VIRWAGAEAALARSLRPDALDGVRLDPGLANGDLHASADYRAHLAGVLARRATAAMVQEAEAAR
jgi:carbon-monoxide dehydrogenase medium subunit